MCAPSAEGKGEGDKIDANEVAETKTSSSSSSSSSGPIGLEGLEEDESLFELVGQDYGMMAMLRNEKFRGLIVYLRNIDQREWVSAVAKEYGDDDEVKGMMVQLGKLMHMKQYYENKKRQMRK